LSFSVETILSLDNFFSVCSFFVSLLGFFSGVITDLVGTNSPYGNQGPVLGSMLFLLDRVRAQG